MDKTIQHTNFPDQAAIPIKAIDNGDGTYSFASSPGPKALGSPFQSIVSITRPANITAYAAGDALADAAAVVGGFEFQNCARAAGGGFLLSGLMLSFSNGAGTLPTGEIYLFDRAVTSVADNAAFVFSDAEALTLKAIIPFGLIASNSLNSAFDAPPMNKPIICQGTSVFGLVKLTNAYAPAANSEVLQITLQGLN